MAYEIPGFSFSLPAGIDFSTSNQFRFVELDANGNANLPVAGGRAIGVRYTKSKLAEAVTIVNHGIAIVETSMAVPAGSLVATDANGAAVVAVSAIAAPTLTSATTVTTGGTGLAATTAYYYVMTGLTAGGQETTRSNEVTVTTGAGAANSNTVNFPAAPAGGARLYRGTAAGLESGYYTIAGGATSFLDTGAAFTVAAVTPPNVNNTGNVVLGRALDASLASGTQITVLLTNLNAALA